MHLFDEDRDDNSIQFPSIDKIIWHLI